MDHPLPELYPIVIPPLYSRPFECFGEGLRYRGPQGLRYARESLVNIKTLLLSEKDEDEQLQPEALQRKQWKFKKFKKPIKSPDPRTGIFWNAQLRLYGIESQPSKPEVLRNLFKDALKNGLRSPSYRLIELDAQLNRQFVLENAHERDKQYEALAHHDTDKKILHYPKRFFREFFADGTNSLFTIQKRFPPEVQDAAEAMGLHFGSAKNIDGEFWTMVGRDLHLVCEHLQKIENERKEPARSGKRQKVVVGEDTTTEKGRQLQTVAVGEDITPAAETGTQQQQQQEDVTENDQESFRKMDVIQMDRLWRTLDDDRKLELYPTRFLSEHFFSEGREKFVQAFKDDNTHCPLNKPDKKRQREIRAAAELLGLRVAIAENHSVELSERWTVIGRDQAAVEKHKKEIETLRYEAVDETEQFELFPKRFLFEHLLKNGNEIKDRVVIFKIETLPLPVHPDASKIEEVLLKHAKNGNEKIVILKTPPGKKLVDAVKSLGLLMDADIIGLRWVLVGRSGCEFVQQCVKNIRGERDKPEKQRMEEQVEAMRKEIQEVQDISTTPLPFDDVKGEWNIECDGVEWYLDDSDAYCDSDGEISDQIHENENGAVLNGAAYAGASKKMSIFFLTVVRKDPQILPSTAAFSEKTEIGAITETAPRLCANFFLGLFGGLLRSKAPAPQFLSFPSEEIKFTFKGWDEAAGTPFDETLGPRCGSLTFHSRCLFKGYIESMYGTMKIEGRKMSHKPNVECYDWEDLHPKGDGPFS